MEIVTNNFEFLENGLGITLVVFLPLISALVVALLPKKQELLIKLTALGSSLITFILSVIVAIQFDYSKAEQFQLGNKLSWIEAINSNYEIGIDGHILTYAPSFNLYYSISNNLFLRAFTGAKKSKGNDGAYFNLRNWNERYFRSVRFNTLLCIL